MLDFYVVGAKKAGTTSLYYYFSRMQGLCMHSKKELSFLCDGFEESGSFDSVVDRYYQDADPEHIWGAVTPHYLYDRSVVDRLDRLMPSGKFVVILRDPLERAISNYHMMRVQGHESGEFDAVISTQLSQSHLAHQRDRPFYHGADLDSYVVWGEYGRLLDEFLNTVDKERLMVVFLEELSADADRVFGQICEFIGAGNVPLPPNVGARYNEAKDNRSLLGRAMGLLGSNRFVRMLWKHAVPSSVKKELRYRLSAGSTETVNKPHLSQEMEARLIGHYSEDVAALEAIIGRRVPWPRFNT